MVNVMVKTKYLKLSNFYLFINTSLFKILFKFNKLITIALFSFLSITVQNSYANPEGGVVASGNAIINNRNNQGSIVEITQRSDKAIIDWQNFNIEVNEKTIFIQPSFNAITLNRIHSNIASEINGELTANGKLILINQNGILFGADSKVDVNGLIATTANISNENFMHPSVDSYLLMFDEPGVINSNIVNEGQILANDGLIGLVAPNVINKGVIIAKAGKVQIASAETFVLDLYGDNLINLAVSDYLQKQLVINSGTIIADGNQILLTAAAGKELVNSLITNSGALQAKSVANQNGEIIIMAEGSNAVINNVTELKGVKSGASKVLISGLIDASGLQEGESGGKIQILGDNISLLENVVINASGHTGKYATTLGLEKAAKRLNAAGGEILIGGDYLGKGNVPCAIKLSVSPNATVYSDSYEVGDAGRIIFWSDGLNSFSGNVYARSLGGAYGIKSGDGGFVEISGKELVLNEGYYTDLFAASGACGTVFLDPTDITINKTFLTANASSNITALADNIIFDLKGTVFNLTGDRNFTVTANNLINVVSGGTINTNKISTGGDITISSLSAAAQINLVNLKFNAQNGGALTITTAGATSLGDITAGSANITTGGVTSLGDITADSSVDIKTAGATTLANITVTVGSANITTGGVTSLGDITVDSSVDIKTAGATTLGNITASSLLVEAVGDTSDIIIPSSSKLTVTGTTNPLILSAGGNLKNQHSTVGALNLTAEGARWLIYSSNVSNDQGVSADLIGPYGTLYDKYNINSLPTNLTDNILTYTKVKLSGHFSDKNTTIDDATTNKKMITISNLRLTGPHSNNYTLETDTTASGYIGTIVPRQITPSLTNIEVVKTYDGNTSANNLTPSNYQVSNVISSDMSNIQLTNYSAGTYTRRQADLPDSNQTIYVSGLGLDGVEAGNYVLTTDSVSGNVGRINRKPISPAFDTSKVIQKTYDGNDIADLTNDDNYVILTDVVTVDGVKDSVNLMPVSQGTYHHSTADIFGTYQAVIVTDLSIDPTGADAANYILEPTSVTTNNNVGRINPRPLTATLIVPINKVYDGYLKVTQKLLYNPSPDLQNITNFTLYNMVPADLSTVKLNYVDAKYYSRTAGNNKNVIVTGLSLSEGNASSYTIPGSVVGSVGNILPQTVTGSLLPGVTKVYDGTTAAQVPYTNQSISGLVIDGTVNDSVSLAQSN